MKCAACSTGHTLPGATTVTVERGHTTLVLKAVPALVCDTCGEDYLEAEVLAEVERIAEAAVASGVEVLVRDFPVKC